MVDQSLQIRLTQKLALSPQLQQAIRLLQLNRIELDANPLLERDESDAESEQGSSDVEQEPGDNDYQQADEFGTSEWEASSPGDEQWMERGGFEGFNLEPQIADPSSDSLREHLLWQINLSHFSDSQIAAAIVYGLDDDGFLHDSIQVIRASLAPELLVEEDEVLAVLHRVQRMEPVGVATRDAGECILVQLSVLPGATPARELALRVARDFLELVARHDFDALKKGTGANDESLSQALDLIQSLEPRPGARYDNRRDEYLVPDVYVTKVEGKWGVTLNPENDPGLRLNNYYIDLLRKSGDKEAEYLRGRLQEARWLMSSLEMRNRTLLLISQSIVELQEDFLEHGDCIPGHHAQIHAHPPGHLRIEVFLLQPCTYGQRWYGQRYRGQGPSSTAARKGTARESPERSGSVGTTPPDRHLRGKKNSRQVPGIPRNRFIKRAPPPVQEQAYWNLRRF